MIKILFYIENLSEGGAEKVLRNLVNSMDQTKFDITIQTLFPVESKKYLNTGIHYKSVYNSYNKFNQIKYRLETALGLIYQLHMKDDYDIEVADLECGPTKVLASSTNKKAVKVAWVHCELKRAMPDPLGFAQKTKKWYNKYNRVVCVSNKVKKDFVELFGFTPESVVVYNTVDDKEIVEKSNFVLPYELKKDKVTIVTVGRLTHPKNMLRLLKAYKRLKDEGFDCNLWIVGEGEDRSLLESYINENQLQDSVTLWGFQDNPYPFMKQADLLVCSSIYEGFSTCITEGLILGKPIVTTDCSGMRELLGDSEYGLITDNDDDAFYDGIKSMFLQPNLMEHYKKEASLRGENFKSQKLTKNTENFFQTILTEKKN